MLNLVGSHEQNIDTAQRQQTLDASCLGTTLRLQGEFKQDFPRSTKREYTMKLQEEDNCFSRKTLEHQEHQEPQVKLSPRLKDYLKTNRNEPQPFLTQAEI